MFCTLSCVILLSSYKKWKDGNDANERNDGNGGNDGDDGNDRKYGTDDIEDDNG